MPVYVPLNRNGTPITLNLNTHYISPYGYNTSLNSELSLYEMQNPQAIFVYAANETLIAGKVQNESITISNPNKLPNLQRICIAYSTIAARSDRQ